MKNTEKLQKKLIQCRIFVSDEELKQLLSYGQEIEKLDTHMYVPTLSLLIKRLGTIFYSKDIDSVTVTEFVTQIKRKRAKISVKEIDFVFENIINGKTNIDSYFKLAEVLRIIDDYLLKKSKVNSISYELNQEEKKQEQLEIEYSQFLQNALKKWKNKGEISIYEKCAIGKKFEFDVKESEFLKGKAHEDLDEMNKKIERKHNSESFGLYIDAEIQTPVFWTKDLLYHFYLFTHL